MGGRGSGRPPRRIELRRKLGNPGKRKLPARAQLVSVLAIERPEATTLTALEAIERVLDHGVAWLGETDLVTVTLLREVGAARATRDRHQAWIDLTKLAHSIAASLGFDPASRSKLALGEVRAKSLSLLEQQRQARRGEGGPDA